jgi:Toastrack DUF4097
MTTARSADLEHVIGLDGLLSIRIRDGRIRLRGSDGDVVRVTHPAGRDLADLLSIESGDGSLELDIRRHRSIDLEVELPRAASLVVETVSADIDGDGLTGDQRYRTASGDLGFRAATGRLAIETVSGDVKVEGTALSGIAIRSVSGDIELRATTIGGLDASTTSGDIDVVARLQGPGPFRIETVSGDGVVATSGDLRVETTTLSGDLHSDVPARAEGRRGRRSLIIGTGQPVLTFQSMSGDLSIVGPRVVGPRVVGPRVAAASASARRPAPTKPEPIPNGAIEAAYEDARLRILRALERGEIDIDEASRRFEALDGAGQIDPASETMRTAVDGSTDA